MRGGEGAGRAEGGVPGAVQVGVSVGGFLEETTPKGVREQALRVPGRKLYAEAASSLLCTLALRPASLLPQGPSPEAKASVAASPRRAFSRGWVLPLKSGRIQVCLHTLSPHRHVRWVPLGTYEM